MEPNINNPFRKEEALVATAILQKDIDEKWINFCQTSHITATKYASTNYTARKLFVWIMQNRAFYKWLIEARNRFIYDPINRGMKPRLDISYQENPNPSCPDSRYIVKLVPYESDIRKE